jgi:hypothetical protein
LTTGGDSLTIAVASGVVSSIGTNATNVSLKELKLPSSVKCRGRPKGMDTTTIGLPSKRSKKSQKVKPFILKHPIK